MSNELIQSNEKWYTRAEMAQTIKVSVSQVSRFFNSDLKGEYIEKEGTSFFNGAKTVGKEPKNCTWLQWLRKEGTSHVYDLPPKGIFAGHTNPSRQSRWLYDEYVLKAFQAWSVKQQTNGNHGSSPVKDFLAQSVFTTLFNDEKTEPASVEYVTRSAYNEFVSRFDKLVSICEEQAKQIADLTEQNRLLQLQVEKLLALPATSFSARSSSVSLPAPAEDSSDKIPGIPLKSFCVYMGIATSVIINRRCLPGTEVRYVRDEFPLYSRQRAREYVQWVLEKIFDSRHRYEWLQEHPSWAARCGIDL